MLSPLLFVIDFNKIGRMIAIGQGSESEQFAFVSARYRAWEFRGGPVRTTVYATDNLRTRMAIAVHYAGYAVGVAREGTPNGLGPSYQFLLSSVIR